MNNIKDAMERLEQLDLERDKLKAELRKSLALQAVWPDAFDHGPCGSQVVGNPRDQLTFNLKFLNGETRSVPLEEVPVTLWSEQVKDDIRKLGPMSKSRYFYLLTQHEKGASNG